ncbi:MAG: hypothetical protein GY713_17075 [Actinomycetia bacterium]|nr:hypothetical protein [Actinomycetes bacterium]
MSGLEDRLRDHLGALDDLDVPTGDQVVAASRRAGRRRTARHRRLAAAVVVAVLVGGGLWWGNSGGTSELATSGASIDPAQTGPHPATELCVDFLAAVVPTDGDPIPDTPNPATAEVVVLELPPPSTTIFVILLGDDSFFSCEVVDYAWSKATVAGGNSSAIDLTPRPEPDSVLVLDQSWSSRSAVGTTGPAGILTFGRAGQNVTAIEIELTDRTATPGLVNDGWFIVHAAVPDGVPQFGERITWTLATGETHTALANTLSADSLEPGNDPSGLGPDSGIVGGALLIALVWVAVLAVSGIARRLRND